MPKKLALRLFIAGLLWMALIFTPAHSKTEELNVLFLGFEENKLEMVSVFTVDCQDDFQSKAVFIPVQSFVPVTEITFRDYYEIHGLEKFKQKTAALFQTKIAYHVLINNLIMDEVEEIIGELIIDNEVFNLKKIFTNPHSPQDEKIMGELMARFTRKEIYFWKLPLLIGTCKQYVQTDFPLTLENLWLHYKIAINIPTTAIKKEILPVNTKKEVLFNN